MFYSFTTAQLYEFINFNTGGVIPNNFKTNKEKQSFREKSKLFSREEDRFYIKIGNLQKFRFFPVDRISEKLDHIKVIHNDLGHFGRDKLIVELKVSCYGIKRDEIVRVLKSCVYCLAQRTLCTKKVTKPIVAYNPRDRYIIDMVELRLYGDVNDGVKWILVLVDIFSKYAYAVECETKTAATVMSKLKNIFNIIGHPIILHSDNGKEFKNEIMTTFCKEKNIVQVFGRKGCPWIQGQVERLNQTIKGCLSKTSNEKAEKSRLVLGDSVFNEQVEVNGVGDDNNTQIVNEEELLAVKKIAEYGHWISYLSHIVFCYNKTIHDTTRKIPFEIFMVAFDPRKRTQDYLDTILSFDANNIDVLREEALDSTDQREEYMVKRSKHRNDDVPFSIGMKVMIRRDMVTNPVYRLDLYLRNWITMFTRLLTLTEIVF